MRTEERAMVLKGHSDNNYNNNYNNTLTQALTPSKKQPRGQGVLADLHPLRGLVHLHIVQPALGLPSAPPRRLCLPRCAAVYAERGYEQLA